MNIYRAVLTMKHKNLNTQPSRNAYIVVGNDINEALTHALAAGEQLSKMNAEHGWLPAEVSTVQFLSDTGFLAQ